MMKTLLTIAGILSAAVSGVQAQAPTPPPDPQIAPLPQNISYTKTYAYTSKAPEQNLSEEEKALREFKTRFPKTEKLDVTKTGQIRKEIEQMTNGTEIERWKSGQISFLVASTLPGQILVNAPGMSAGGGPFGTGDALDFSEMSWVSQSAFSGAESRQGTPCFVYKNGAQRAWINASTRLPEFFESPEVRICYVYKTPDGPLELPAKYVKKFEDVTKAWTGRAIR